MSALTDKYLQFISGIRRYSPRTQAIYRDVLTRYEAYSGDFPESVNVRSLRNYEMYLLDECGESPRTVDLHLSVLSGFARFLMREGLLASNPVRLVPRPKKEKRLPDFFREESLREYLAATEADAGEDTLALQLALAPGDKTGLSLYRRRLSRLIISLLYSTGVRRSELVGLNRRNLDLQRGALDVLGKGNKKREIPLVPSLCKEISLYLESVDKRAGEPIGADGPLLVTENGGRLYPVYVDRVVKRELGGVAGISGRKSPHVLRHTLATELLDGGADLNSIKELLGHSSLAATQVYTHNTVERLKNVYDHAHPRAKNTEKHGSKD